MVRIGTLLAFVLLAGCDVCEPYAYETTDNLFVREDDPAEATVIAQCFANDASCERLCMDLLGPPPAQTIRAIQECVVNRDGGGGLNIFARSRMVQKCNDDWGDDDWDWNVYPDAQWQDDAPPAPDAWQQVDATPPDATL